MRKLFFGLLLLLSTSLYGMEESDDYEKLEKSERVIAAEEIEVPSEVLRYFLNFASESDFSDSKIQTLVKKILTEIKCQPAYNPPIELVLQIIDHIEFCTSLELFNFLFKLSLINRHWQAIIKPNIVTIVCKKFSLPKKSTKKFIELIQNRSGIPLEYLQDLLVNREKQKKIKKLRELANIDLKRAIKKLESAVYKKKRNEAMDIIMSLPIKIYHIDFGNLLKYLIQNSEKSILRMLIGIKINIDAPMIPLSHSEQFSQSIFVFNRHSDPLPALMYSVLFGYAEMVDLLIKADVNINATDEGGFTALDIALRNKDHNLEQLLKKHGAEEGPKITGPWSTIPFTSYWTDLVKLNRIKPEDMVFWFEIGQICNRYKKPKIK